MSSPEKFRYNVFWYYFALIFTVLPLFFVNMYFNISQEKWLFFIIVSIAAFFFMIVSFIYDDDALTNFNPLIKKLSVTDFAMLAFLIISALSTLFSDYPVSALLGDSARYHGLSNFIAYFVIFFFARKYCNNSDALIKLLVFIGAFVSLTAICQYLTWDPIGMYKGVTVASVHRMISTIGNRNIYASYLSIVLPLTVYLYISEKQASKRLAYGLFIAAGFAGAIAGNSDSVYIGVLAGLVIMLACGGILISEAKRLPEAFAWGSLGAYLILAAAHFLRDRGADIRPSQGATAFFTEHTAYMLTIFAVLGVISLIIRFITGQSRDKTDDRPLFGSRARLITTAVLVVAILAVFVAAFVFFPFPDEFGSYRGFIWRLAVSDFGRLSLFRKFFGYGPETVWTVYNSKYYNEMISITGVTYDNVHCEPLEYLVTSGILGFAAYMLLVVSLLSRLYRRAAADRKVLIYLIPIFTYFTQSFVNIAQSATTPIFFLIMALGNGYLITSDICASEKRTDTAEKNKSG